MVNRLKDKNTDKLEKNKLLEYFRDLVADRIQNMFFIQERIGKGGKVIRVYKIRTMEHGADKNVPKEVSEGKKDQIKDPRIIESRAWMRKWGVDEFPQLLNILKGDMGVFGARPVTPDEFDQFDELLPVDKKRYQRYKPGMFGAHGVTPSNDKQSLIYKQRLYLKLRERHKRNGIIALAVFHASIFNKCILHLLSGKHK